MEVKFKEFCLGVNYWPRNRGINMWQDWHPEEIAAEFAEMKSLGLNTARVFLVWNDFQPIREIRGFRLKEPPLEVSLRTDNQQNENTCPGLIDPVMISHFDELLGIAKAYQIRLIPTLFVGWMSGTSLDIDFRNGKNIFTDPTMLKYQAWYVRFFAQRYRNEEIILAWDLGNEHNCFMECPSRDAAWLWTRFLRQEIWQFDQNHPVTSGMHSLGMTLAAVEAGSKFLIRDLAEEVDFLTVHPYQQVVPVENSEPPHFLRNTLIPAWQSRLYQGLGRKRVLCEEFGSLGRSMMSLEIEAKVAKTVLYSMAANYDLGVLWWCHTDFNCKYAPPYEYNLLENDGLGLFDQLGNAKPVAQEFANFAQVISKISWDEVEPAPRQAAIMTPWRGEPNIAIFNAFVLSKQAGLEAEIISPEADLSHYKLLIVPSLERANGFKRSQWDLIMNFVEQGGVLYLSYNGCSIPEMERLFGFKLQYRWQEPRSLHQLRLGVKHSSLSKEEISLRGEVKHVLKVLLDKDKVLGTDEDGQPMVFENNYGLGKTVFSCLPLELLINNDSINYALNRSFKIYEYLKAQAQIDELVNIAHPALERVIHTWGDKKLAIVVNHSPDAVEATLSTACDLREIKDLETGVELIGEVSQKFSISGNSGKVYVLS